MSSEVTPRSLSIFLVEDEPLILMMVADMIQDLGHTVTAKACDLKHAISLAETAAFDVAILDFKLQGEHVEPVAEILSRRNLPFIFASGYSEQGCANCFGGRPVLRKPFILSQLAEALQALRPPEMAQLTPTVSPQPDHV
jgi:CheY-like chemotaxis protein